MPTSISSPKKRKKQMTSILPDALDIIDEASEESSVATSLTVRSSNKTKSPLRPGSSPSPQSPTLLEANISKTRARRSVPISPVSSPDVERPILSIPLSTASIPIPAGDTSTSETIKHSNTRRQTEHRNSSPLRGEITVSDEIYESSHGDEELLAWRLDPKDALSDWTIRVTNKDDNRIHTFHVRKSVLVTGKRKSEYFVNVFQRNSSSKSQPVTDVGFSTAAIQAMPFLLDYMYSTKPPRITSEWAMGMRFLAQFFGLKLLFKTVMDFIQKDLSMSTILPYCRDSINLKDEKMMGVSARHIGRNILQLQEDHPVLDLIDPSFLMEILSATGFELEGRDLHRARIATAYIEKRRNEMDENTFLALTTEVILPVFDPKTALTLLGLEIDIVKSLRGSDVLTPLQTRCIRDVALHWTELSEADPEETTRIMNKLPAHVVSELLMKSLSSARKNNSKHRKAPPEASKRSESPTMTPKTLKVKMARNLLKGLSSPGRLFIREGPSPDNPGKTILRVSPRRPPSPLNIESTKKERKDPTGDQQRSRSRDRRETSESKTKSDNDRRNGNERRAGSGHSRKSDQDRKSGHSRSSDQDPESGPERKSRSGQLSEDKEKASRGLGPERSSVKEVGSPSRTLGPKSASTRDNVSASPARVRETLSRSLGSKSRSLLSVKDRSSSAPRKSRRDESGVDIELLVAKHNAELMKLKHEHETSLAKLRDLCLEKDQHIALYWEEIRKYERLPNDARLMSSGGLTGGPTKMPEIGNQPRDGQLLLAKKGGTKYAVFYYKCD